MLNLVTISARLPAELMTPAAWDLLRSTTSHAIGLEPDRVAALANAGLRIETGRTIEELTAQATTADLVVIADTTTDEHIRRRATAAGATVTVVAGSWDPPGARLLDAVAVMDRLRSPGGCPWDAEQTHESLTRYLLEETYEALEALQDGDSAALREELGDVLLQVLFHARLAEDEIPAWSIDDVAAGLVEKLVRRHPHVFADVTVTGADEVHTNWDAIKKAEKKRDSVLDGVPLTMPALMLAQTLQRKATRAGIETVTLPADGIGAELFALTARAQAAGVDAELALRDVATGYAAAVRAAETGALTSGETSAETSTDQPAG